MKPFPIVSELLSVLMSFLLAFTLMPLPAYAQSAGGGLLAAGTDAFDAEGSVSGVRTDVPGVGADGTLVVGEMGEGAVSVQDDNHGHYDFPDTPAYMEYTVLPSGDAVVTHLGSPHNGPEVEVSIPATVESYPVVGLDATIEDHDFWFCSYKFASITIPNSVEYVQGVVFQNVKRVVFDSGSPVTSLPDSCFEPGNMGSTEEVVLPDGLQAISKRMFYRNGEITSITVPDAVKHIREEAFCGCEKLSSVTLGSGLVNIGNRAFAQLYLENSYVYTWYPHIKSLKIPDMVTSIGDEAFSNVYTLENLTLGSSLERIGDNAFAGTSLTSLQVPNSVVSIGAGAFTQGRRPDLVPPVLASLALGTSQSDSELQYLGARAFAHQPIRQVVLPNKLRTLGYDETTVAYDQNGSFVDSGGAFSQCDKLESVTWPENPGLGSVGGFDGCTSLDSSFFASLPNWVTAIDDYAFYDCRFANVNIPQTVTRIGKRAFGQSCQPTDNERAVRGSVYKVNNANVTLDYGDSQADWPWSAGFSTSICYPSTVAEGSSMAVYRTVVEQTEASLAKEAWWQYGYTAFWTLDEYERSQNPAEFKNVSGTVPVGASVVLYVGDTPVDVQLTDASFTLQKAAAVGTNVRAVVRLEGYEDYMVSPSGSGMAAAPLNDNWSFTVAADQMTARVKHAVNVTVPEGASAQLLAGGSVETPELGGSGDSRTFVREFYEGTEVGIVVSLEGYSDLRLAPTEGAATAPLNDDWSPVVTPGAMTPLSTTGTLQVLAAGDGAWRCNVAIFDSAGRLVEQGAVPTSMMYVAEGLPAGNYTVVAFAHNDFFSTIGSVDDFAMMGIPTTSYAVTESPAVVSMQKVTEVSLDVPAMDLSALNDVVESGSIVVNNDRIVPKLTFYARVTYQMKDGHPADEVTVSIPEGISVVSANTSAQSYGVSGYSDESHTLTLNPVDGDKQGSTVFVGLRVDAPGDYSVSASARSGAAVAPIGSLEISAPALLLQVPNSSQERTFLAGAYAAPGTTVRFTLGSTDVNATVTTNKSGWGVTELTVPDEELSAYSLCKVTAKIDASGAIPATEVSEFVSYKYIAPELAAEVHELKFHHAGTDVYVVKDGREPENRYYTCVVVGRVHTDLFQALWPFSVSIDSAYPLEDTLTLQLGMLDKSVRDVTLNLVRTEAVPGKEPIKRYTYTGDVQIGTGDINDDLTLSDIPFAFDVSYTFKGQDVPEPTQAAIDVMKESYSVAPDNWEPPLMNRLNTALNSPGLTHAKAATAVDTGPEDLSDVIFGAGYRQRNWSWDKGSTMWNRILSADERRTYRSFEAETDKMFNLMARVMGDRVPMSECASAEDYLQRNYGYRTDQGADPETLKQQGYKVYYDNDPASVPGAGTLNANGDVQAPRWYAVKLTANEDLSGMEAEESGNVSSQESDSRITASYVDSNGVSYAYEYWKSRIQKYLESATGSTELWELSQTANNVDAMIGILNDMVAANSVQIAFWNSNLAKIKSLIEGAGETLSPAARESIEALFKETFGYHMAAEEIKTLQAVPVDNAVKMARIAKGVSYVTGAVTVLLSAYSLYANGNDLGNNWSEQSELQGEIDYLNMMSVRYVSLGGGYANSPCHQKVRAEIAAAYAYQGALQNQANLAVMDSIETAALATASLIVLVAAAPAAPLVFGATLAWGAYNAFEGMSLSAESSRLAGELDRARAEREEQCGANRFKKLKHRKDPIMDPSGYVYAGVEGNRLSGVQATIYQVGGSELGLDKWDAAEYNQVNHQTTDVGGLFGWDVPGGTWRIGFELDGYDTAWSADMGTPPEWTNVAVNLLAREAKVSSVGLSGNYIVVKFQHYMKTATPPIVTVGGKAVAGTWTDAAEGVNEACGKEQMARTLRVPVPAGSKGKTLSVKVSGGESYAGVALQAASANITVPADPPKPTPAPAVQTRAMHRLYNPYSGEHFYTADANERNTLTSLGWRYEGVGWNAPTSGANVYRLYNRYSGDHHFTTSTAEKDACVRAGWTYEGVGWKSGGSKPVYREYNPYASCFYHNYTASAHEHRTLCSIGWKDEGVGWYGV